MLQKTLITHRKLQPSLVALQSLWSFRVIIFIMTWRLLRQCWVSLGCTCIHVCLLSLVYGARAALQQRGHFAGVARTSWKSSCIISSDFQQVVYTLSISDLTVDKCPCCIEHAQTCLISMGFAA